MYGDTNGLEIMMARRKRIKIQKIFGNSDSARIAQRLPRKSVCEQTSVLVGLGRKSIHEEKKTTDEAPKKK